MNTLSPSALSRAEFWLLITTLIYFLMNGAQIFETFVIIAKWAANPPESFSMFRAPYGLDLKTFWIVLHSIHEITFIVAIIFCWRLDPIRNGLLVLFAIHVGVRVWTIGYFAPNIIEFQKIANDELVGTDLLNRVNLWRTMNYIRVGIFVAISIGLVPIYLKVINMR